MRVKFIIGAVVIILLVVSSIVVLFFSKDTLDESSTDLLSEEYERIESSIPAITEKKPSLRVKNSQRLIVRDFMSDEDTYVFTPTTVFIGDGVGVDGKLYEIFYFPEDGSVTVSLLSEPFAFARDSATKQLMESFGVSGEELCLFDIWVSIPNNVSPIFSGQNLGLSFCPGSVSLE